jgi:hypothetical protein
MPAPIRPAPTTVQQNSLSVPKGIVGYYTDAETEQLIADALAGLVAGDLTQEQIDAILAQVGPVDLSNYYTKPEVET